MARRLILELIGDPQSLLRSFRKSADAADVLGRDLKALGVTAEQSAKKQVQASVARDSRLRSEVVAYRQIASAAKAGSREQISAANLASRAELQLSRSIAVTSREQRAFAVSASRSEREIGRATRGALAGSGVFRSMGRSLAFASGGFLVFASGGQLIRKSIDEATKAAATERQLGAQFRAVGQDLGDYRQRIDEATLATSKLSGFTRDDLKQSFLTAFRGSKDVGVGLRIQAIAADVARGRHIGLAQATLALTKAYGGQSTALRRLGILVPTNLKGMQALELVGRRFAGQAQAGTTAQDRFAAALQNTEVTIGRGLLPQLTRYLTEGTNWLDQEKNQQKIQRDVNQTLRAAGGVVGGFADAIRLARGPAHALTETLGGVRNTVKLMLEALAIRKLATFALGEAAVGTAAVTAAEDVALLRASLARLGAVGLITVGVDLVLSKKDRGRVLKGLEGPEGTQRHQAFLDIKNVGQAIADATVQIVKGNVGHSGHTLGFNTQQRVVGPGPLGEQTGRPIGQTSDPFARQRAQAVTRGVDLGTTAGPLGFKNRFARQELRLAQAQLTTEQADDRRVLVVEAGLIRQRIKRLGNAQKTLAERTQLTQQLGGVEGQITAIDQQAFQNSLRFRTLELRLAQAQLTATQADDRKILALEAVAIQSRLATLPKTKATLDARIQLTQQLAGIEGQISSIDHAAKQAQLNSLDKQRQRATNQLQKIRSRETDLKSKIKAITDQLAQTVDTIRGQIGELFQGPVLAPTPQQIKAKLGVKFETLDPRKLTQDLNAQVKQFAAFEHQLAVLAKRGAPKELLKELQGQGLAAAPEVAALASASPKDLRAFFKAFGTRERLAITSAKTEMKAQLVSLHADRVALVGLRRQEVKVEIDVKGIDKKAVKVKTRQTPIAGGRNAGR